MKYRDQVELVICQFVAGAILWGEKDQIAAAASRHRAIGLLLNSNAKRNVRTRMADIMANPLLTSEEAHVQRQRPSTPPARRFLKSPIARRRSETPSRSSRSRKTS